MTRINTNVSSLSAQKSLATSQNSLQQALTRLSTGLRINAGKDDPAGLISSEALRSDMISIERAVSNNVRANQVIATADSSLGQVSALLNDIRGLVTEAANSAALSDEQIAANQLQVDSSLEAINRIAQMTSFQGRKLLDGSLDFVTTAGSISTIDDIQIDQANLGPTGQVSVSVDITSAATRASVTSTGFSAAAQATATINFAAGETWAAGTFNDVATSIAVTGTSLSSDLSGVSVIIATQVGLGVGNETAVYNASAGTLTVTVDSAVDSTAANVVAAINNQTTQFHATVLAAGALGFNDAGTIGTTGIDSIAITAATAGPDYNDLQISVATSSAVTTGAPTAVYNAAQNTLLLTINDSAPTALAAVAAAIVALPEFSGAVATANGSQTLDPTQADPDATANTGSTGGRALLADLVVELGGLSGSEVFSFQAGAAINQLVDAVNLVSDSTGVTASRSGGTMTFRSTAYGSDAFTNVNVLSEATGGTFESTLSASRATGSDIVATVNGIAATGDGNEFSINTSALDLSITVTAGSSSSFNFSITGGGALFQLGPDVVTAQQARLGIGSVNTASLRGESGRLYELGTGGTAALDTDTTTAASIVEEVISKVASLRGRLGAFQKTTIDPNIAALNQTLENLTEAESSIRDADFAAETAALTRAQILVQSGTSVLAIANSNPQNVLALLR